MNPLENDTMPAEIRTAMQEALDSSGGPIDVTAPVNIFVGQPWPYPHMRIATLKPAIMGASTEEQIGAVIASTIQILLQQAEAQTPGGSIVIRNRGLTIGRCKNPGTVAWIIGGDAPHDANPEALAQRTVKALRFLDHIPKIVTDWIQGQAAMRERDFAEQATGRTITLH